MIESSDDLPHRRVRSPQGTGPIGDASAASIAHELNNVLAIIRGHLSLARRDSSPPVTQRLDAIDRSIDQAASLVLQLSADEPTANAPEQAG